jgi:rRNA maturation RNase YbeY
MYEVNFFSEEVEFTLKKAKATKLWLLEVIKESNRAVKQLSFIFTSDEHLARINKEYLNHNTYTDIITFPYSEDKDILESDVFISVDRVEDNAQALNLPFYEELHRVMVHGILHLLGYHDKTASQKREMRNLENHYLALRKFQID